MNHLLQFERSMLFCKIITIFLYKMLTRYDYLKTKEDNYYGKMFLVNMTSQHTSIFTYKHIPRQVCTHTHTQYTKTYAQIYT